MWRINMTKQQSYAQRAVRFLGSSGFFWFIVAVLVVEAGWIALSSIYPMAFDEDFHLGIIRLYAHHISPFWSGQPAGADGFGAVARDPSYLYHYLMSFPYRLINGLTHNLTTQVLVLRAFSIAMFAYFIVVSRRLLLQTGASRAIIHSCLLVFVLVPVVPLLAAQINYDNMWLPLTALTLLQVVRFDQELRGKRRINAHLLLGILSLCLLTSLVKYAFLPIFIAIIMFLAVQLVRTFPGLQKLWRSFTKSLISLKARRGLLLVLLLLVSSGLFVERYGVNVVRYHNPIPDCGKVLTVQHCISYGPWHRDYDLARYKSGPTSGPIAYSKQWLDGMGRRLYFSLAGPSVGYQTRDPMPVPARGSQVFAGLSLLLLIAYGYRLFRRYNRSVITLLCMVTVAYVGLLWLKDYETYVRTGKAVAVNGRYLFPVLPWLILLSGLAASELLHRQTQLKVMLAGVAVCTMLWGGGVFTYILRSNDRWYWPSPIVRSANHAVQRTLGPVTPGYR